MLSVAFALGAAFFWGTGDFLGGLTTRRASLWAVIAGSQLAGLAGAVLVVVVTGHPWPGLGVLLPVFLGGVAGVVAISCFYTALAIGTMSIVAPISATSATIPFLLGLVSGERPSALQLAAVVLTAVGVVLTASEPARAGETIGAAGLPGGPAVEPGVAGAVAPPPDERGRRRNQRRAVLLSLVAAAGMGLTLVGFDMTARHDPLWAMTGGRMSTALVFALLILVMRPRLTVHRAAIPFIVVVGLADTAANGLFALATTKGYLSIVAVLGSVYPVVTVVLAYTLLHERIARRQQIGVVLTLAGVAVIAAG